jgi:hypothetical protein
MDGDVYYIVEQILEERAKGCGKQYLVKWEGYPDPTWELASYLKCTDALQIWRETQRQK